MTRSLLFCLLILIGSQAHGGLLEPSGTPSLISIVRNRAPLEFCGEAVLLDDPEVRERAEKELLLTLWDRPQVILWAKRANRYLPLIEAMIKEASLPEDLKYIPLIESALRPDIGSPKGAVGFWQFLPETAQKYGLTVNAMIDERRNVIPSTGAALRYLKALYIRFGSWAVAAAAFNMGEEGMAAEILAQGTRSYCDLYLPLETQRYIFRILAAKQILSDPSSYGFHFTSQDLYPPLQFDRIRLDLKVEIPILMAAKAAKTTFKKIKDLNPEIRGYYLPPGSHNLTVPRGAAEKFQSRFEELLVKWQPNRENRVYVVQQGDTLSSIADRFRVPLPALLIWNRRNPTRPIYPGDRLIIAPEDPGYQTQ
ncbi:MAG: LysM peptidoglycan-binding domain-containing protein [Desulfobacteraceae bacterium]|nr:MAG: LysM peptidoglycan-binding domain-containing protein [Desulfobacteraceae bacterium]